MTGAQASGLRGNRASRLVRLGRRDAASRTAEDGYAPIARRVNYAVANHLEKILAHAERELASAGAQRPADALPVYRKFLKIEEYRLRLRQQAGGGGREVCARRVDLVDVLLRHVFAATNRANGKEAPHVALIALGGYGRRELNPFSDVDVMFLHG